MGKTGRSGPTRVLALSVVIATAALTLAIAAPWKSTAADPVKVTACSVQKTKSGLRAFVRAYNRGDFEKLDVLFDDEPGFQWFSMNSPRHKAIFHHSKLIGHFEGRHRRHDRLHIRRFGSIFKNHGGPEYEHATHFSFYASRRTNGFHRGRWFRLTGSKGAVVCDGNQPRFIVLSLGGAPWLSRR